MIVVGGVPLNDTSNSETPLRASFNIRFERADSIATVGQAYKFLDSLSPIEWMEFRSLHADAKVTLEAAAGESNAKPSGQRLRFVRCWRGLDCFDLKSSEIAAAVALSSPHSPDAQEGEPLLAQSRSGSPTWPYDLWIAECQAVPFADPPSSGLCADVRRFGCE
jgi:hypothetical protein